MTILTTFSELRDLSITAVEVNEGSSDYDLSSDFTLTFDNGVVLEFKTISKYNFKWNEWKIEVANSMHDFEFKNAKLHLEDEFEENEELSYLIQLAYDFLTNWEEPLLEHLEGLNPAA